MSDSYMKQQILKRLQFDNPWWISGKIPEDYHLMRHRLYLDHFLSLVERKQPNRAVILMGPRRVGKTVMLFHTIESLIMKGVNPQKIIFVSIDIPIYSNIPLEDFIYLSQEALKQTGEPIDGYYIFFDEIQYLKNWEGHLKTLVDSFRNSKFIASGSAAAALKMKSGESGAGRFSDFMLPPLTFNEYIHLLDLDRLIVPASIKWCGRSVPTFDTVNIDILNEHFINYINYGGYPELVLSKEVQEDSYQFIRRDIVDKVLLKDLPSLYGIQDIPELNRVFVHIVYNSGSEFSYESLSRDSGVKKETVRKYLQYLEAAFLIKVVHKVDENARSYRRATTFKIYLYNPSLRCALFSPITASDPKIGSMVETAVYAQWLKRDNSEIFYARWNHNKKNMEVDMVAIDVMRQKPSWAVEIKWTDRYVKNPGELLSLLSYLETNGLPAAVVTTKTEMAASDVGDFKITYIPSAIYAYIVGHNTILYKQNNNPV